MRKSDFEILLRLARRHGHDVCYMGSNASNDEH